MNDQKSTQGLLTIYLGTDHVGDLTLFGNDATEFRLSESYRALSHRPVLGQIFEDDLTAAYRSCMQLPPFFSNMLSEGRLWEILAA